MNIVLINGSPKGEKSCSKYLLEVVKSYFDKENNVYEISIADKRIKDVDKFHVLTTVIKFLDGFEKYTKENNIKCDSRIYGIVNCGFYEGKQNRQALKILRNFTNHIEKLRYGGGIGIGTGPFIGNSSSIPWQAKIKSSIKEVLDKIIDVINSGESMGKDLYAEANMNKVLYMQAGNFGWISSGFKNKVYITSFNKKPYKIK